MIEKLQTSNLVHIDLKSTAPPKEEYLLKCLDLAKKCGATGVVMEYEDKFPYECCPSLPHPNCYDKKFISEFEKKAGKMSLDVIPLVQSLAHVNYVLKKPDFAKFRRIPEDIYDYAMSGNTFGFLKQLYEELLTAHPKAPFLHIGCDEAWVTRKWTPEEIYRAAQELPAWINGLSSFVKKKYGIPIAVWSDLLYPFTNVQRCFPESLRLLNRDIILVHWNYHNTYVFPGMDTFLEQKRPVILASCANTEDRLSLDNRWPNLCGVAYAAAKQKKLLGQMVTYWGRSSSIPWPITWIYIAVGLIAFKQPDLNIYQIQRKAVEHVFGVSSKDAKVILEIIYLLERAGGWVNAEWANCRMDSTDRGLALFKNLTCNSSLELETLEMELRTINLHAQAGQIEASRQKNWWTKKEIQRAESLLSEKIEPYYEFSLKCCSKFSKSPEMYLRKHAFGEHAPRLFKELSVKALRKKDLRSPA